MPGRNSLKASAGLLLCGAVLLASACSNNPQNVQSSAVSPVVESGPETGPDMGPEVELDMGPEAEGARARMPAPRDAGHVGDVGDLDAECERLRDGLAADTASCARMFPDVGACQRITANFSRMTEMGCRFPDAGIRSPDAAVRSPDAGP